MQREGGVAPLGPQLFPCWGTPRDSHGEFRHVSSGEVQG